MHPAAAYLRSSRGTVDRNLRGGPGMNIFVFGSSILSSYWNGAATYYRGIYKELHRLGHRITFAEPDAFGRQQHLDPGDYSYVRFDRLCSGRRFTAAADASRRSRPRNQTQRHRHPRPGIGSAGTRLPPGGKCNRVLGCRCTGNAFPHLARSRRSLSQSHRALRRHLHLRRRTARDRAV